MHTKKEPIHKNTLPINDFYIRMDACLSVAKSNQCALVSVDFDNFKYINDLFGYEIGNKTLEAIINHFSNSLKPNEFFCNVNADNFLLFLEFDDSATIATRLYNMTNTRNFLSSILPDHYNFVASGGVYKISNVTESQSTMVDCANFARKKAKGNHSSTFIEYSSDMGVEIELKKQIILNMEQALELGEFEMYVQPKVLLDNNSVIGGEALVRWNNKTYGLIYPDKFIPVFEQNGFVTLLDFYVLEEACIFLRKCIDNRFPVLPISVNFSKLHISITPNLVNKVAEVTSTYGIDPCLIEIEFTESVISMDFDVLVGITSDFQKHGFKVSLDDFGSAYSSLNHLKDLPINIIKLDKCFLDSSANNEKGRLIIAKIVDLIKSLHLQTVVEGIEHEHQVDFLKKLGCEIGQGYFYAKPMPKQNYLDFISNNPIPQAYINRDTYFQVNEHDYDNDSSKAMGAFPDITHLKSTIDYFKEKSQQDSLTKLYNKESTKIAIDNVLSKADENDKFALLILDVDNFKGVNDNLGHQFGDTVLVDIAKKIRALFRDTDILGRVGGDEFIILMNKINNEAAVCNKANELVSSVHNSYYGENVKYNISCSIGVAYAPKHGKTFDELYRLADKALYETKNLGKDNFTIYSENIIIDDENIVANTPMDSERFLTNYFEGDPVYSVFEMLYETKDIATTINKILEMTGKRFGVDRVYIFEYSDDNTLCNNTYEWCAEGITPEIDNLQNLSIKDMSLFLSKYSSEGIYVCNNISSLDKFSYDTLSIQGIKSLLHCAIFDEGKMKGFIGFDDCKEARQWHGEEIAILAYIARVLSTFILKKQISRELYNSYQNQTELLNNLPGYVYVINRNTYETFYLNKAIRDMGCNIGQKCYEIAFGTDKPCENCPSHKLNDKISSYTTEIFSQRIDGWVSSAASKIPWNGVSEAALICCTDISKYKPR